MTMYKISLINMPFADLWFPSIALTQLKHVLEEQFGKDVRVRIHYLNQDIAQYFGVRLYCFVSNSLEANMAALGDWLFSGLAFPGVSDNTESYFQRCFPGEDAATLSKKQAILRKRKGLGTFLDRLIAKYGLADEDLVGFTSMFCQNVGSFAMARRIKDRNPKVITTMGGANCEAPMGPELARNVPQVDYVFSGPGLISFPRFVATCIAGKPSLEGVRGVFGKENAAAPSTGMDAIGEEMPIDHYIPLNYQGFLDTLAKNFAASEISPVLTFETSRGCWWGQKAHCTFCGLNGGTMAYRAMSPENAIKQFQHLFSYAPTCTLFNGVDNILPKSYLKDVMPHLDPPENVELFYEVKADLSRADVETLARAHVKRIQPGIEALATSTLKLMRKGTTAFQNLTLLKHCLACGVQPEWNLLIGFPGEPESVFKKYVDVLPNFIHLPPPSDAFHVRFDRYSPYFEEAQKYGLDLHPSDFYSFIYPFDEKVLSNMAYYFADHNYGAEYIANVSAWSARVRQRVADWRSRWQDRSQLHPVLEWRQKGGKSVVYDSRDGNAVEHELDANAVQLLAGLARARSLHDIQTNFATFDAAAELANLQAKGLVFEEDGRYLSLVIEEAREQAAESVVIEHLASESPGQGLLRVLS
jgi:ribosomal peptide maturation radical SAM protein 1